YKPASYHPEPHYNEEAKPFAYNYAVNDHYSGANFAKKEQSDGHNTQGYYSVTLPDGRVQHVKYVADNYGGYNAEVTYEGEAQVFVIVAALAAAIAAAPAPDSPSYHPEPHYKEEAKPFAYDFAVSDHYTGTNFVKKEESDGHNTQGYYSVALPDGRVQHVKTQHAGYKPAPAPYHLATSYKPASYHPGPNYEEEAKPFAYDHAVNDHYTAPETLVYKSSPAPSHKPASYHPEPQYKEEAEPFAYNYA
ncbi:cuticle protein 21-like, partial [Pollicipes pollicipes]|uniref:cuticle protein 21-like n=1 Tax=Pollicipes pollicipes TaxID=41117 RepID=UPI0018850466